LAAVGDNTIGAWAGGAALLDCFVGTLFYFPIGSKFFIDFFVEIVKFDFFDFTVYLDLSVLPSLEPTAAFLLPSFDYLTFFCDYTGCNYIGLDGLFIGLFMGLFTPFVIGNFTRRYVADYGIASVLMGRGRRVTSWLDYILSE